jgi:acyl-CoA thioesterase-1
MIEHKTRKLRPLVLFVCAVLIVLGAYHGFQLFQKYTEVVAPQVVENIPSPPEITQQASTTVIAVLGDSISAGYGISLTDAYPAILERALNDRGFKVTVLNAGVSGDTTAGGKSRAAFVRDQKPQIVIVALGGNDVLRGIDPASSKENLRSIIKTFQDADIQVVLAGMYAPANLGETYGKKFNAMYPELAAEFNVPLIPFLLEGVVLDKSLNQNDGIHPNEAGARIIAEKNVLPKLLPLLQ